MKTKIKVFPYKKIMIFSLCAFVVVLFSYALVMNYIVANSKKLVGLEEALISIQTKITQTEHEIMTLRKPITREYAMNQGFIESSDVVYVKKDTKTAFLNE